ncbi:hypothetical protein R2F61_01520 [Mollicutes bacterium LVI A0078]|nr:hypothetical protein RZE84_01515 [Mollicutes bacterium LVI A0075]WOO91256.1 hypothetical protein R2F61_01520 [Mollicutes bacterium LVI A0078]
MSKQTLKVVLISVICTLLSVAAIGVIAAPKVVEKIKTTAVVNYEDEYSELAYILDESKGAVIQPNYIITGLIMSPDFQEYLDEGVQNGWWTEEFLEQFLIDEALPIFFTNYHVLFSVILGSEPVQGAGEKVTLIKAKVEQILYAIKGQVGRLSNILNSGAISDIKSLVATLQANKDKIAGVIATLQGLDIDNINSIISQLENSLGQLEEVISAVKNLDIESLTSSVENLVEGLTSIITAIQNLDTESLEDVIATLKDIKATVDGLDKEQLAETIEKVKAIVETIQNTDFSELIELVNKVVNLVESIQNGEFDGLLGDILENIISSDAIQDILNNIELTVSNIIRLLQIYFTKFVDIEYDYNFNNPVTIPIVGEVDLSAYARILNVIDVEIPEDAFVYDNNGTAANLKDDTLTINAVYVGFEIDGEPTTNVLSEPIVITGANASIIKNFIPTINNQI